MERKIYTIERETVSIGGEKVFTIGREVVSIDGDEGMYFRKCGSLSIQRWRHSMVCTNRREALFTERWR
jgi:hypothetical protein